MCRFMQCVHFWNCYGHCGIAASNKFCSLMLFFMLPVQLRGIYIDCGIAAANLSRYLSFACGCVSSLTSAARGKLCSLRHCRVQCKQSFKVCLLMWFSLTQCSFGTSMLVVPLPCLRRAAVQVMFADVPFHSASAALEHSC